MLKCPHCGSTHLWKNGHSKNGTHQYRCKSCLTLITTEGLPLYPYAAEELFGKNIHKRVYLGHNNAIESRYSLFKDFVRAKRGFKKFSNIFLYINGFAFTHNLYKDCGGDKNAVLSALFTFIIYG